MTDTQTNARGLSEQEIADQQSTDLPDREAMSLLDVVANLNLDHEDLNWSDWYSAREFRDRRTVFFMDRFDGDATLRYAMRVQIPGEFVVAPARAELMYRPAINTNSASQHFSFRDR